MAEPTKPRRKRPKRPLDHDPRAVRRRRIEVGLTQAEAAKRAGISAGHLCEIERGTRNPSAPVLDRLATTLATTTAELMPRRRERL